MRLPREKSYRGMTMSTWAHLKGQPNPTTNKWAGSIVAGNLEGEPICQLGLGSNENITKNRGESSRWSLGVIFEASYESGLDTRDLAGGG